jgi:hypothetical protein
MSRASRSPRRAPIPCDHGGASPPFTAAWLGWTLDVFDVTVFLFLLVPIAKEFNANLTLVVLHRCTR